MMKKIFEYMFGKVSKKDILLALTMGAINIAAVFLYKEIAKEDISFPGI